MSYGIIRIIKKIFNLLGLDIKRYRPQVIVPHVDAFYDQKQIMSRYKEIVIFDIGSNIGDTIIKYSDLFPNSTIHGFEPFNDTFLKLKVRCSALQNVKLNMKAISNTNAISTFYYNSMHYTNSLLEVSSESDEYIDRFHTTAVGKTEVATITLDSYCSGNHIDKINILKMDIQGGELLALKGADYLLRNHCIDIIYSEVLFGNLYCNQAYYDEIASFLRSYDYIQYGLYNIFYGNNGLIAWGDAIFLSKRFYAP